MLVDANVLLYAIDSSSPYHRAAAAWLSAALNGRRRVGFPWQSIGAFLRISTHPRASESPLSPGVAWTYVEEWLATDPAWVPPATERTASIMGELIATHHVSGNRITDAQLAALALEHGLTVVSADTDFARFTEVRWENPLAGR